MNLRRILDLVPTGGRGIDRKEFTFLSEDGLSIHAYRVLPKRRSKIRAVVQIVHGMGEHSGRYLPFAEFLARAGFAVYAHDHRGHGRTAQDLGELGSIGANGWELFIRDIKGLTEIILDEQKGKKIFMFAHSLGSVAARIYITRYGRALGGLILSGAAVVSEIDRMVALFIARRESKKLGRTSRSLLMANLFFGKFNQTFTPNRTEFDWLSRDEEQVDLYLNDPLCGRIFVVGFYQEVLTGIKGINSARNLDRIPRDLPIHLIAGEKDATTNFTKGALGVIKAYKKVGIREVSYRFYPGARHELLNETNAEEVRADILSWLEDHI